MSDSCQKTNDNGSSKGSGNLNSFNRKGNYKSINFVKGIFVLENIELTKKNRKSELEQSFHHKIMYVVVQVEFVINSLTKSLNTKKKCTITVNNCSKVVLQGRFLTVYLSE